jgi:hypothetical protein
MRRTAIAAVLTCLATAPAAVAKGPHAAIDPGPEGLRPGQPWVATITLVELRGVPPAAPVLLLRSGDRRFAARPVQIGAYDPPDTAAMAEARYRIRTVFPSAGRWTYTLVDRKRRYRFPAATIGNGAERVRTGYVAFPEGSHAEGAGGPIGDLPEIPPGGDAPARDGGALPPVVVEPPDDDGGGIAAWLPAAGLALAGAAAIGWRRRR